MTLHHLTVTQMRTALQAGDVSSVELVEHHLARIADLGERLGAFATVTPELALEEARRADGAIARGESAPLLGVPVAYKDLAPVAGVRTTFGSRAFADFVAPVNGPVVERLRAAGAVTLGMTHAPEFGPTCFTESAVVGRAAVSPYEPDRYASGSSGGAAAAVAAGLLPLAHASDGAGSIRTPAAVTGLVGLKPSRGLLPSSGGFVQWNAEGVLTRTVEDTRLALSACRGAGAGDLYPLPAAPPADGERLVIRMAVDPGLFPVDDECVAAVTAAADVLRGLGHEVHEGPAPVLWTEELVDALRVVVTTSIAGTVEASVPEAKRDLLHPYTAWCHEQGSLLGATDLVRSQARLAEAARRVLRDSRDVDVLLTPTTTAPARPVGWFTAVDAGADCGRRMLAWSAFTPWANISGLPALSVPSPLEGRPLGVQLTGSRLGSDERLLGLAAALERETGWANRHPAGW